MKKIPFNDNWICFRNGQRGKAQAVFLPHDAMIRERRDSLCDNSYNTGYYPGGKYVYEKTFRMNDAWKGQELLLEFEGVYRNCQVLINGAPAGAHRYGYGEFTIHLSDYLLEGQDNTVTVIVDNSQTPNSRWYSGSGITRSVNLLVGGNTHIAPDGVRIHTQKLTDDSALLHLAVNVENAGAEEIEVVTQIFFQDELVAAASGRDTTVSISAPHLWSDKTPCLYTAITRLQSDGRVLDEHSSRFGIRTVEVSPEKGLLINGTRVFLNGGCVHNDNGVIGAAAYEAAERRRIRILKEAGFNAIRSAHNPISRAMLDACDEYGMYVMDEAFDMWFSRKTAYDYAADFRDTWGQEVDAMVKKDFNHPSVILYSIGNEIIDIASPRGAVMARLLHEQIKKQDDTRKTIICANLLSAMSAKTTNASIDEVDPLETIAGANTLLENKNSNALLKALDKTFGILTETSFVEKKLAAVFDAVDVAGYNYCVNAPRSDHRKGRSRADCASETYPHDIIDNYASYQKYPNMIGDFVWTGWDYIGEASIGEWDYGDLSHGLYKPYPALLAGCGLVDITGHVTQQAYFRQIVTGLRGEPYLTVRPLSVSDIPCRKSIWKQYDGIHSWSWSGYEGCKATVEVYSDGAFVELFLNDRSLGKKKVQNYCASFEVPYQPGNLLAVAYNKAGKETGRDQLNTASDTLRLSLNAEKDQLSPDPSDLLYLNISFTDGNGVIKPLEDKTIEVTVQGVGCLMGLGSARPITKDEFASSRCQTYMGRALAVLQTLGTEGDITVTVTSDNMSESLIIPVRKA